VIFGCVSQVGQQAGNVGRQIVLGSRLPQHVPGTTVDRQCGSSQQALHFAAQAVMSGTQDIVIAGGIEVMSRVPIGSNVTRKTPELKHHTGYPNGDAIKAKYNTSAPMFSQFTGAELLAKKYGVTKQELDASALRSHARAARALSTGVFASQIVSVKDKSGSQHTIDQGVRGGLTMEKMAKLKLLNGPEGRLTAGTASQISDGAACLLIMNEDGLRKSGLTPRAEIVSMAVCGSDPVIMLEGPIPATEKVLRQANLSIQDMDVYEVNEAFASVPLAWAVALKADLDKLNPNGGAMALGHPLGCTGAKLMTQLVNELERGNKTYGLQAICEGGGTANATVIKRVGPNASIKLRASL
jgi:acetyl-CoA C-acetyltransferase